MGGDQEQSPRRSRAAPEAIEPGGVVEPNEAIVDRRAGGAGDATYSRQISMYRGGR